MTVVPGLRVRTMGLALIAASLFGWPAAAGASMLTAFAGGLVPGFSPNGAPTEITTGPDGNLWFTEQTNPGRVAYMDDSGIVHELTGGVTPDFTADQDPVGITTGPPGFANRPTERNIWFTESGLPLGLGAIAEVTPNHAVHEFVGGQTPGLPAGRQPAGITVGPDRHIWFTEQAGSVAYIDDSGIVHAFPTTVGDPTGITSGRDGNVWFTEALNPGAIGYITPDHVVHEFKGGETTGFTPNEIPAAITVGPDGHIWFTESSNVGGVAYIDDNGRVHEFHTNTTPGFNGGAGFDGITAGRDGNVWFTDAFGSQLGRVNFTDGTQNGTVTEFRLGERTGFHPVGITTGPDGNIWFAAQDPPGSVVRVNGPDVSAHAAAVTGPSAATLNGTVNPNATTIADCHFEFGTSTTYGASIPCTQAVGGGTSDVPVSAGVGSLLPGRIYHFRVVAGNVFGMTFGADQVLAMPPLAPSISTGPVARTGLAGATLTGSVVANGAILTDCHFDYGASTSYGSAVPCAQQVGGGNSPVPVSADVTGLAANSTYHFRLVAANAAGTGTGIDVSFTLTHAPMLSSLRLSPSRFQAARRERHRAGAEISYRDTDSATTTLRIERCGTPPPHRARRCAVLGSFTHADRPGVNRLRFTGRLAGRPLGPGKYTLVAVATAAGTSSAPASVRFEVTR